MNRNSPDPSRRVANEPPKTEDPVDETLVDEAVAETLPASDPISPYSPATSKPVRLQEDDGRETSEEVASGEPPAEWQGWKRGE